MNSWIFRIVRFDSDWSSNFRKSRSGVEGYDLPPLTQKLNEKSKIHLPSKVSSQNYDTHVTKLDNDLRVASEKLFGEFCTVGGMRMHYFISETFGKNERYLKLILLNSDYWCWSPIRRSIQKWYNSFYWEIGFQRKINFFYFIALN